MIELTRSEAISELQEMKGAPWNDSRQEESLNMAIKALRQEPCDDAISRQAVQDYIAKYLSQYLYNDVREAVEAIDEYIGELPSVTQKSETVTEFADRCRECGKMQFIEDVKAEIRKPLDENRAIDSDTARAQAIALSWCLEIIERKGGINGTKIDAEKG